MFYSVYLFPWMVVSDSNWSIREIRFSGRSGLLTFENLITMGDVGDNDEFLPKKYELNGVFPVGTQHFAVQGMGLCFALWPPLGEYQA